MTTAVGRGATTGDRLRRLGVGCLLLSAIALPALLAGSHIGEPPAAGEVARLGEALSERGGTSEMARQFLTAALWSGPAAMPEGAAERAALVSAARLAQVGGILATTLLLYLVTMLARGRLQALVACVLFAALPAVGLHGHVLRPETGPVVFVVLAALLMQCLAHAVRSLAARGPVRRALVLVALSVSISLALGLAVAGMPALGGCLLLPGVVMVVAAVQIGSRALRIRRRRTWYGVPVRAMNTRLWPWTLTAVLGPVAGLWLMTETLRGPAESMTATRLPTTLLPEPLWAFVPLVVLLLLGAVAGVLRIGLRFGRRGRVGQDFVLLAYCGTQLAYGLGRSGEFDMLPAAPAMAIVLSEGAFSAIGLLAMWLLGRRRQSGEAG